MKVNDERSLLWNRFTSDRNKMVFSVEVTMMKGIGMQVRPSWRCGATKIIKMPRTITFSGNMNSRNFALNQAAAIMIPRHTTVAPTSIRVNKADLWAPLKQSRGIPCKSIINKRKNRYPIARLYESTSRFF